jgi:hypothetical protein
MLFQKDIMDYFVLLNSYMYYVNYYIVGFH